MQPTIIQAEQVPAEVRIFLNHVYEYKKGIRPMVLYTLNKGHQAFVERRLKNQSISYYIQEVSSSKINLFFGDAACMQVIKNIVRKPLNELNAEQDFIIGALLGYDLARQCKRYACRVASSQSNSRVS